MLFMYLPMMCLCAQAAGQVPSFGISEMECYAAFAAMKFDIRNFSQYGRYFANDSVLELAQGGQYIGIDEIEEYARFTTVYSPVIVQDRRNFEAEVEAIGFDPSTATCQFRRAVDTQYVVSDGVLSVNGSFSGMVKLHYSAAKDKIMNVDVYYDVGAMRFLFDGFFHGHCQRSQDCVCDIMQQQCPDTWKLNGFGSREECVQKLDTLPDTEGEGYFDGNSQGCRHMHGTFAMRNPSHCAHLSFVPQMDKHGRYKCQKSKGRRPDELFTQEDIEYYRKFNLHDDLGYTLVHTPCSSDYFCLRTHRCVRGACSLIAPAKDSPKTDIASNVELGTISSFAVRRSVVAMLVLAFCTTLSVVGVVD